MQLPVFIQAGVENMMEIVKKTTFDRLAQCHVQ